MKKLILAISFVSLACSAFSQQAVELTGAQILRSARAIYDQGRLHELPVILEEAVKSKKLSQSEKVEAYKILILTYIYLEEPAKADMKMIELLKTDHFFQSQESDPVEFKTLLKKFRTDPLFNIALKIGGARTQVNTIKNYFILGESKGKGTIKNGTTLQFTAVFEKKFKDKFVIAPELVSITNKWTYNNANIYNNDPTSEITASVSHIITQKKLQLNGLIHYIIGSSQFEPYVTIGPGVGYLLSSSFAGQKNLDSKDIKKGAAIDNTTRYKSFDLSAIIAGGARLKMFGFYLTADARYQYGLMNVVNGANRYKQTTAFEREQIWEYSYVDNDFSLNQIVVNLGLSIPVFSPKKMMN